MGAVRSNGSSMAGEAEFHGRVAAVAENVSALAGQTGPGVAGVRGALEGLIEFARRAAWVVDDAEALAQSIDHLEAARRAICTRP